MKIDFIDIFNISNSYKSFIHIKTSMCVYVCTFLFISLFLVVSIIRVTESYPLAKVFDEISSPSRIIK